MNSFYGGMKGNSFNIVKTYESKDAMLIDFLSPSCEVGYGDYVVISSSDINNGDLYKRTENFSVNNGALFIVNLSGSIGKSSTISFSPDFNNIPGTPQTMTTTTGSMIPGYYLDDHDQPIYIDNISYKTQQSTINDTVNTTIAFQFPYPVLNFTSKIDSTLSEARIVRKDDGSHPYYYSYELQLPETVQPNRIKKMEVIIVTSENINDILGLPQDSQIIGKTIITYTVEENENLTTVDKQYFLCYFDFIKDINYNSQNDIITFTYNNNEITNIPLRQINGMTLDTNGKISVTYSNTQGATIINDNTPIKWIKDVSYSNEQIVFTYNTNEQVALSLDISDLIDGLVTNVSVNNNGTKLLITKSGSITPIEVPLYPLKQISDIIIDDNGIITRTYTDGTSTIDGTKKIKWIEDITFDQINNQFVITYNTKHESEDTGLEENDSDTYVWQLKTITSAVRDGADLLIKYNIGNDSRISNVFQAEEIDNFVFDSSTGKLTIDFGENDTRELGTITYVHDIKYNTSNHKLQYAYQNSPADYHDIMELKMLNSMTISDENNHLYANYNTGIQDLGELTTEHILDIEMILDTTDVPDPLAYLRTTYPNGYNNNPYYCIAAGPANKRTLYAYGYYKNGTGEVSAQKNWYPIGDFTKQVTTAVADNINDQNVQALPIGGIWFIARTEQEEEVEP